MKFLTARFNQSINAQTDHVRMAEIALKHPTDSIAVVHFTIQVQLAKLVIYLIIYILLQNFLKINKKKIRIHVQAIHV